jgi:membrane-associated protease RseP (regulator of RpoE activity)
VSDGRPDASRQGTGSAGWALVRLALVVGAICALAVALHLTDLLLVLVALAGMIMLHELGHFLTAKWSGMKVTEFFLGFGPRLWSIRRGETEYGVKAIPAGGYVRIVGMSNLEEVDPADEPRAYRSQSFPRRLLVAVAGSAMHGLLALGLLWGLLTFVGVLQPGTVGVLRIAPISRGVDPAEAAGLRSGDQILAVDGRPIHATETLVKIVEDHPGEPLTFLVRRHGVDQRLVVRPAALHLAGSSRPVGRIGVLVGPLSRTENPIVAVGGAAQDLWRVVAATSDAIATTFSPHGLASFFNQLGNAKAAERAARAGTRPESIVGAVHTAAQAAAAGPGDLIAVLVSIDVFVGMANLFPMLPLDGGHVAIAVYERIRSRRGRPYRADVTKLAPVAYAFILFLVVFVGSAVFLDITHPVVNPFG